MMSAIHGEEPWAPIFEARFSPNVAFISADAEPHNALGRAIPFHSEMLLGAAPTLQKLVAAAREASCEAVKAGFARSAATACRGVLDGLHPTVECDKSGENPLRGWRHRVEGADYNLCESEYLKLEEKERSRFAPRVAPTIYPCTDPTDADDGLLTLALPGTRRAIALMLRAIAEEKHAGAEGEVEDRWGEDIDSVFEKVRACTGLCCLRVTRERGDASAGQARGQRPSVRLRCTARGLPRPPRARKASLKARHISPRPRSSTATVPCC